MNVMVSLMISCGIIQQESMPQYLVLPPTSSQDQTRYKFEELIRMPDLDTIFVKWNPNHRWIQWGVGDKH